MDGDVARARPGPATGNEPRPTEVGPAVVDGQALERLDRALLRLRRTMVRPPTSSLPIPSLGRPVDLAKVTACWAIARWEGAEIAASERPTVKDIAGLLELEHSTASRLLSEAEAEGLVVRGSDPADRRRTTLAVTDLGRKVVADSLALREWAMSQILRDWPAADIEILVQLLERLADTVTARLPDVLALAQEQFASPG